MKTLSIVLAYSALGLGALAALTQLWRLGLINKQPGRASLWVHRVAGYAFAVIILFLFAGMVVEKIPAFGGEIPPRVAWHAAAGFAVVAFLLFKWAVVRPFRGLLKIAPALGITVFALAFVVVNLAATFIVVTKILRGPAAVVVKGKPPAGVTEALASSRFVVAEKCGKCHSLHRVFRARRTAAEWAPVVDRMRGYRTGWIDDADAAFIIRYISAPYGPGEKP